MKKDIKDGSSILCDESYDGGRRGCHGASGRGTSPGPEEVFPEKERCLILTL